MTPRRPLSIGVAGYGNVGREVARRLAADAVPETKLAGVTASDLAKARGNAAQDGLSVPVLPLADLVAASDLIAECATASAFPEIARATLLAGKHLICVSAGGVPNCPDLFDLARAHGGKVRVASGALPGLDIVRCAAEGGIRSVVLRSRITVSSMAHEPYVRDLGFDFVASPPREAVRIFEGSAREAARHFPRHFNVAISLSLAGSGMEATRIEIWVDPDIPGTVHEVSVESGDVSLAMVSRNRPSTANPRTSRIVAPSVIAAIRALTSPVTVGS